MAALAMGAVTWVLRDHLSIWLLVPLAGAIYLLLIVLLKGFEADDIALFHRVLRPSAEEKS